METLLRYRGRAVTATDVGFIQELIAGDPGASRRRLSEKLCAAWGWVQANGTPRSMVCRSLMLALARAGHIELPPVRWVNPNPLARRTRPKPVEVDQTPLGTNLAALMPLTFRAVRRTPEESFFNGLVEAHHYLGYTQPVGEHLKYIVYAGERPLACFAWSSAPRHLGPRDRYLGWSATSRRRNIRFVVYNSRYLILPWVHVEHLASHLLGRMVRMLPGEWERAYGHPVYFAETFVDAERFRGTCYRAANWIFLGHTTGRGKNDQTHRANRPLKQVLGYPLAPDFRQQLVESRRAKERRQAAQGPRIDLKLDELPGLLERAKEVLSPQDHATLTAMTETLTFVARELLSNTTTIERLRYLLFASKTEKTSSVLGDRAGTGNAERKRGAKEKQPGHGRNGAAAYTGAGRVKVAHPSLHEGDACPGCEKGRVYPLQEPATLVRITGVAPLGATIYEKDRWRCNLCGDVFTAPSPEGVGEEKYDEKATSMVGLLKYGTGLPFNRIEKLQGGMGIPLPATTQWELVRGGAKVLAPAHEELIREAAHGEVLHNDDTTMKVLELTAEQRAAAIGDEEAGERTGIFTSGIVATACGHRIALFFTGAKHAGENLSDVLTRRQAELPPPIQMCDALSANTAGDLDTILANCMAHGRRKFVGVADNFPAECRLVLETLREVYKNDSFAKKNQMSPAERLHFHQTESGPLLADLETWMRSQLAEHKVEPNSGLGEALRYMLKHWSELTLFLREPGAPLDNNLCERALKKAILHRKNALFYKTLNGAHVGDVFMSLIHSAELNGAKPFDYLVALLQYHEQVEDAPADWMPWNYAAALARVQEDRAPSLGP